MYLNVGAGTTVLLGLGMKFESKASGDSLLQGLSKLDWVAVWFALMKTN